MKLDDAYANAAHIEGAETYPPRWEEEASAFRENLGARAQQGVKYGPSARQTFDFFQPEGVARGTMIFVHGGYWKAFDASVWSHLAAGALARGWAVAGARNRGRHHSGRRPRQLEASRNCCGLHTKRFRHLTHYE